MFFNYEKQRSVEDLSKSKRDWAKLPNGKNNIYGLVAQQIVGRRKGAKNFYTADSGYTHLHTHTLTHAHRVKCKHWRAWVHHEDILCCNVNLSNQKSAAGDPVAQHRFQTDWLSLRVWRSQIFWCLTSRSAETCAAGQIFSGDSLFPCNDCVWWLSVRVFILNEKGLRHVAPAPEAGPARQ